MHLCHLEDIPDGEGRGFVFGDGTERYEVFVVRRGADFVAYENSCPHLGTPLDFVKDRFLSKTGRHIQCSTHRAQFRIDDGHCISGPCEGAALTPAEVTNKNGELLLGIK